ncbi:MAG TPA: hypothetical protein VFR90_03050 [Methylibium sp.]|uniref:hypothetical protein n=1 Tax=Methylibium sp. TaxID=2067992 RepID=UPI002DB85232|nr:hypothetical protein [Methylibium sp.]HEU4458079.1 hypothetical protein [Methylibium sp.]
MHEPQAVAKEPFTHRAGAWFDGDQPALGQRQQAGGKTLLRVKVNVERRDHVLRKLQLRAKRFAGRTGPRRGRADGVIVMHVEGVGRLRKTEPAAEGPEILSDAGLACRMDSGPERGAKEACGRTIARRSWAARGHRPRRK